jgi:hypothetical protein
LNGDDPDHPYNWIKNTFGLDPYEFGYSKPETGNLHERSYLPW